MTASPISRNFLTPREVGEAIGVSKSSLKRWVDDGRIRAPRTAGGHRRIAVEEAVRFIREMGLPVKNPALLGLDDVPSEEARASMAEVSTVFHGRLRAGDAAAVRGLLTAEYLAGRSVAWLCDELIVPAMREIGRIWREGVGGIVVEHRASDLCLQALGVLKSLMVKPAPEAPVAVGGGGQGDPYLLGSLCVSACLASRGWRETNLGPDTPMEALIDLSKELKSKLVWVSFTHPPASGVGLESLGHMAGELAEWGGRLLVGGQGVPESWSRQAQDYGFTVGTDMKQLDAFAAALWPVSPPAAS